MEISLELNGRPLVVEVAPDLLLADLLRETLGLTGTHIGCDTSQCGACVVHVDGASVKSCTMLAVSADGAKVTSIEGLAEGADLHPMQAAFHENHGLQCGFCTPGMVMSSLACLEKRGQPTPEQMRQDLSGNLCRCGTYGRVMEAIDQTAKGGGK